MEKSQKKLPATGRILKATDASRPSGAPPPAQYDLVEKIDQGKQRQQEGHGPCGPGLKTG